MPENVLTDPFVDRRLPAPTVIHSLQELARLVGPEEALAQWTKAAAQTGMHGMSLDPNQICLIADCLRQESGTIKIFAIALQTRCITHRVLSKNQEARS